MPSTTTRQGYAIADNTNHVLPPEALETIYDPVARTISITGTPAPGGAPTAWLTPGLDYKLVFFTPPNNVSDIQGFRAIDRAPLDATQNRTFVFKAGPARGVSVYPNVDFCADVLPIFVRKCDGPLCHGSGDRSAASLVLTSNDGVRVTAVGRVAQASNTGGRSSQPVDPGAEFGVDMALIAKGNPGASWLMYKVEMAPHPVIDASAPVQTVLCTPPVGATPIPAPAAPYAPLAPVIPAASDGERARLEDYILGRYMPYPTSAAIDPSNQPLTFDERERIRIWIALGADTSHDCGGCGAITVPDGGTAAASDAGAPRDAGRDAASDAGDAGDAAP